MIPHRKRATEKWIHQSFLSPEDSLVVLIQGDKLENLFFEEKSSNDRHLDKSIEMLKLTCDVFGDDQLLAIKMDFGGRVGFDYVRQILGEEGERVEEEESERQIDYSFIHTYVINAIKYYRIDLS